MNSYFYLNEEKQPQGPHTLDELRALLDTGKLTENTLAAPQGGSSWQPLVTLLRQPAPTAALPAAPAGDCPRCGTALTCTNYRLPERCPACAFRLRAANPNDLWQSFVLGLRKFFVLKGRATRMELWSFVLFSIILSFVIQTVAQVCSVAILPMEDISTISTNGEYAPELLSDGAMAMLIALALVCLLTDLLFTIPRITVTVRRLHDVGRSGKWVLAQLVLSLVSLCGLVGYLATSLSEGNKIQERDYVQIGETWYHREALPSAEELAEGYIAAGPEMHGWVIEGFRSELPVRILLPGVLLPAGLAGLIWFYILILCFVDSQRGPNRYGPSPKYPLA